MSADRRKRLLVVDGQAETTEVLRAIFEPRGMEIDRVKAETNRVSGNDQEANLIVLHEQTDASSKSDDQRSAVPRVIIGRMERSQPRQASKPTPESGSSERYLSEPFHYGELVQAIEDLLADADTDQQRAA
ncbi:hypothetical protein [Thalassoroseus pseudoceratinae]|uniref:hypothetical protein n=1 Tax=Thalassoroseus pseudoceratinae TaxID=2713176 RepID=UPI0014237BC9|nr:hypothetical protein [Thalassoroseus pseudoceratinae]